MTTHAQRQGYLLPRVIYGNRGDLASRWALLRVLRTLGLEQVVVFRDSPEDVPEVGYTQVPYGRLRNLLPTKQGARLLREASHIIWGVGLDIQDDSSLAKLVYLNVLFDRYRRAGLTIWCLFQGAGPLKTSPGRWLTRRLLKRIDCFVARDPGTYQLLEPLSEPGTCLLGHDAIFLPGFTKETKADPCADSLFDTDQPVIGLNIRQWYHFSSNVIPYQFATRRYRERSMAEMEKLEQATQDLVRRLRDTFDARVVLLSAYQPDVQDWEDDLFWLLRLHDQLDDPDVRLADWELSMPAYFNLMSRLDVMIGMRLHSTLIALRHGVPALNISYTLKGRDIMMHLGLGEWVVDLEDFVVDSTCVFSKAAAILDDLQGQRARTANAVQRAVRMNQELLETLLKEKRA